MSKQISVKVDAKKFLLGIGIKLYPDGYSSFLIHKANDINEDVDVVMWLRAPSQEEWEAGKKAIEMNKGRFVCVYRGEML